jgi:hypothetical protein
MHIQETPPKPDKHQARLNTLNYGAIVRYEKSVYVKVDSHNIGSGLTLRKSRKFSVLCNLKLGTLREVDADKVVTVFDCFTEITKTEDVKKYKRY